MTPEKQQIAIAEACGWTDLEIRGQKGIEENLYGRHPWRRGSSIAPDYTEDLNAMHDAEKILIRPNLYAKGGWGMYLSHLSKVTDEQHPIDATAAQRAEAFLRTIGKWEGE